MERRAEGSVLLSGVLWGVISLFVRFLSAGGLDSFQIAEARMSTAALVMAVFLLITDRSKFKIRFRDLWMFFCTGIVSVALMNFTYFYTISNAEPSVASVLLYTSPAFVLLLSALFFREKPTAKQYLALVLMFVGCILVAGLSAGAIHSPVILLTGIGSGLTYALYTIFSRFALKRYSVETVTFYTFLFAALAFLPFCSPGALFGTLSARPELIAGGFGIGLISGALPFWFYTWGMERMASGKAAILVAVEPVVGCLVGMLCFHDSFDVTKIFGIVLIVSAIVLLGSEPTKKFA
ncbi:MAG: EamA family transporter [Clostridia bacterium]|nr:EamA family transporter [Clostridia bacterium]